MRARAPGADSRGGVAMPLWNPGMGSGLHAQVTSALGVEIVEGRLAPGSILNLEELGRRFSVGRSVLRESLRVLESLGMIEPRQRLGTQVLPRSEWDLLNPKVILWRGSGAGYFEQMRELLELRLGIEPVAARLSAQAMSEADTHRLAEAARRMVTTSASGDAHGFLEADVEFHDLILRSCGNSVIAHFATTVEAVLRTRTFEHRFPITDYTPASADRHDRLAAAIAERDPATAFAVSLDMIDATVREFDSAAVTD